MRPRVGVLFVHGIGTQARGRTLLDWGGALSSWITRWTSAAGASQPAARLRDAVLAPSDSSEPPHFTLEFGSGSGTDRRVLIAESWWADTVVAPTYVELLRWSLLVVPWTIASHFLARLTPGRRRTLVGSVWSFVTLLLAMMLMPAVLAALVAVLLVGLIPIPQVRAAAAWLQRGFAATIGDSLALLNNPVQRSAIVGRVQRDLVWLDARCDETVVLAHSQGAAIAHEALQQSEVRNVTLVTFGSGLGKLLETEWLMRGGGSRWVPWLFSAAGALVAIVLWRSVPALWAMRGQLAVGGLIWIAFVLAVAKLESRIPKWAALVLSLAAATPVMVITWKWLDESPWAFVLLVAQFAIVAAFNLAAAGKRPKAATPPNVAAWVDLHGSSDPVSSGGLFAPPPVDVYDWLRTLDTRPAAAPVDAEPAAPAASVEVSNERSFFGDHTSYWKNPDDFVAKIAWLIGHKVGVPLDRIDPSDVPRLVQAARRRRWRTAWLAAVRACVIVGAFFVVGARIPQAPINANAAGRPLLQLHQSATSFVAETVSAVTPDLVLRRTGHAPAAFADSGAAFGVASRLIRLFLLAIGYLLIAWRWSAWDAAEVARLFARADVRVLETQFVMFLFVCAAVLELIALTAAGWTTALVAAPRETLIAIGNQLWVFAFFAAYFWILRTMLFFLGNFRLSTVQHGASAAALALLIVAPIAVMDGLKPSAASLYATATTWLVGARPFVTLAIILSIWIFPITGVWRGLEPCLARLSFAGVPPRAAPARPVETATTAGV